MADRRRCGVSDTYTRTARYNSCFTGVRPKLAVLNYGISAMLVSLGITELEYKHILRKHYERAGYKSVNGVSPFVMWKLL